MGHRIDPRILRHYDIRGRVGDGLDRADAYAIGRGFATLLRRAGGRRVAVGYDGRLSSPALEAALVEGLCASGADVVRIGLGPSPMLYYAEAELGVDAGIQVTGSHNPADENGFKLVRGHRAFFGDAIRACAALAAEGDWETGRGAVETVDVRDAYVTRLLRDHRGHDGRIGWDAGSGAVGAVLGRLTARLPGTHHLLHDQVDGRFPYHHPDPTVEANLADLRALVARERLDCGFAFDGDGDRIGAIDGAGRILWGDQILLLLAGPVLRDHPGAPIIADVKASQTLFDGIAARGGRPILWKTGHALIKTRMAELGAPLAGEMSGHIFFADRWYGFDDALYAALRLLALIAESGRSLAELHAALPAPVNTPELRIPVPEADKQAIVKAVIDRLLAAGARVDRTDGARVATERGWYLLRASNTQAMLTLRAEAEDAAALSALLDTLAAELAAAGLAPDWRAALPG
ncbi:phosphoglucomutase/phosphomannomutase PgmG [Sphingomonas morindae]|uniref:Phosphomannomutase/phosphoglucomutase n=1 Tax=Sphingomonas morindae TaxID=1541170 RepID=A0ABY4X9I3_9SPHN|nr:phosphomannomutase/phosphoglucomutase [Sphingomonas morindae]USI73617.1 phosphomannomutase/phosphoglucomutase [Sphingomonas morindae]